MKVFVGSIDSRHGVRLFASRTMEGLEAEMGRHVRERLLPRVGGAPDPQFAGLEGGALLRKYFGEMPEPCPEWYDTARLELEPEAAQAEGRVRGLRPRLLQRLRAGGAHRAA